MNMMKRRIVIILFILGSAAFCADLDQPQGQNLLNFGNNEATKNHSENSVSENSLDKGTPAVFHLGKKRIPGHILAKGYGMLKGIIYPGSQQYSGKLPLPASALHDPRTGIFLTQPPIGYILYRSKADSFYFDRLLLDANLNDTLIDDSPLSLQDISSSTPVTLKFSNRPVEFDLKFSSNGLKLYPRYWQEGEVTLAGETYKAAIFKSTYGTPYGYGNVLLLDFNKDNIYANSEYELLTEAFLLQRLLVLKGRFYSAAITPDGTKLTLERFDSDYGQITFSLPDTARELTASYKFSFLPQGGSGRDILKVAREELPITLPVGRYGIIEGLVYNHKFEVLLKFACPEFSILKDKRLRLKLDSARMNALTRQDGNKIIAAQKTYGPKNIYFNLVGPADPKDPGPELLIYNADNPEEIYFTDHLEYG